MNNIDKLNQIYRCHDILDERVLSVIKKVKRDLFVPEIFKNFAYTDFSIPLDSNQRMLTPSCEGKIIQSMELNENDNVLIVGTGSGYLAECASFLSNTVASYEIDTGLFEFGKNNLDLHSANRFKIHINNESILKNLKKINNYKKIIFTCSVDSYVDFIDYLGENSSTFFFINQYNSPYKKGIIVHKTRNSYTVNENIVTSQTNHIRD